jgi:AraC family transcriptional regulator of adaptative response/methylated-DNA-[protein]-cysteine methyltransferase
MEKTMANTIRYGFGESALGPFLAAVSERGLAFSGFDARVVELEACFPEAELVEDPAALKETTGRLAALIDRPDVAVAIDVDMRGTAFQCRVWDALREVPVGTTTTYGEIAARIGAPRRAREVGEACAANKLAVVVPCHRVVRKDGSISGYRWGVRRKRALLEREHGARLLQPVAGAPHDTPAIQPFGDA